MSMIRKMRLFSDNFPFPLTGNGINIIINNIINIIHIQNHSQ